MAIVYIEFDTIWQDEEYLNVYSDIENVIDGTDNTFAVCGAINDDDYEEPYTSDLFLNLTNNITRTDYISKVELIVKLYTDDAINTRYCTLDVYNYDDDSYSDRIEFGITETNTEYTFDITSSGNLPGYGFWTWNNIKDFTVSFIGFIDSDATEPVTFYVDSIKYKITTQDTPIPVYGLKCKDGDNNITLNVTDSISRVLHSDIYDYNSDIVYIEFNISIYDNIVGFSYPLESDKASHIVRLYNNVYNSITETYTQTWVIYPPIWNLSPGNTWVSNPLYESSKSMVVIMGY